MTRGTPVAAAATAAALLGAVALGLAYRDTHVPGGLDAIVDPLLAIDDPRPRRLLWAVVVLGDPLVMVVAVGVVSAVCWRARRRRTAVVALSGPALAALVTEFVLKPGVGRTLDGTEAWPSGHTVTAVAVGAVVLVAARDLGRPRRRGVRVLLVAAAVGVPAAVGAALVALGLHYTTDVVGGVCVSVAAVGCVALALDTPSPTREAGARPHRVEGALS